MSTSMSAAGYIVLAIVAVSALLFMSLFPIYVDYRVARKQRQSLSAPAAEIRRLPQGGTDHAARPDSIPASAPANQAPALRDHQLAA